MTKFIFNSFLLLFVLSAFSCKTTQTQQKTVLPQTSSFEVEPNKAVVFLDSVAARTAIIYDTHDNFFEDISDLDMAIQAKVEDHEKMSRDELSSYYKKFMQDDVTNFTKEEKVLLTEIFKEIHTFTSTLNNNIFPEKLKLIKSHERPYGTGTFYTRENCIVIPYGAFKTMDRSAMYNVMLHELFHVYSRLNNEKRLAIYDLIGFKPFDSDVFRMRDSLAKRVLLNPDGVKKYYITLKMDDGQFRDFMPIITAKSWKYTPAKKLFFQYLKFDLYEVQRVLGKAKGMGLTKVKSNGDGTAGFDVNSELPDFFRQIKDNTNYIIHPDEVMADNFMILIQSMKDKSVYDALSEEGKGLQDALRGVIVK